MIRQSDFSHFAEGAHHPRGGDVDGGEGDSLPVHLWGRRCARCGRRLGGGGLYSLGWGTVCWECYHKPGRRDGRADASSDAAGERNSGYNLRR
jgi:hypothetical protein